MYPFALVILLLLPAAPAFAQQRPDAKGCQDHKLVSRMPGYSIHEYQVLEFTEETFNQDALGKPK